MGTQDQVVLEKHFAIWSERDKSARGKNIPLVYASDLELIDPHFIAHGHQQLDDLIEGLHRKFPDYRFTLRKPIEQHHNVARLFWQLGSAERPDVETGMDVFILENGLIKTLMVFIDLKD